MKKEFKLSKEYYLIFFLIVITFFQITMAIIHDKITIGPPLISIDYEIMDQIALAIPIIAILWLIFRIKNPFNNPKVTFTVFAFAVVIILSIVTMPRYTVNINIPSLDSPFNGSTQGTLPLTELTETNYTLPSSISTTEDYLISGPFYTALQFFFTFCLLVFTIIIVTRYISSTKGKKLVQAEKEDEKIIERKFDFDKKSSSIIDSYTDASNILEKRGANDGYHLTPEEFSDDVINKDLTKSRNIEDITSLFEEAKFSDHVIQDENVIKAKEIAENIKKNREEEE